MSDLVSLTRDHTDPRGKPRVYFCCHPDDRRELLDPLAAQLLEAQDCAVWYDPEPEKPAVWLLRRQDLAQMQLFVLPVTDRLLEQASSARDRELPLALERHIPVLPILAQPGLEERFNRAFGNLQCLDPRQDDPTALPYAHKLRAFLDGVLIGGELSARVEAAFDARLFLSYRKDDRYLAQQLMRRIHENEKFRDLAVWYDEFLVPGRPFDSAIQEALKASDVFVLTVTPNLLVRPNYVMEEEYPAARRARKPVLPVRMEPADPVRLARAYPDLPPCIDHQAAGPLAARLERVLAGRRLGRRRGDPEHEYLIGLAYLGGIRAESDPARGAGLIQSAAEAGWAEAMEKLAAMYRTGEGVERSVEQARAWQERLADRRLALWRKDRRSPAAFEAAANALKALGDQLQAEGSAAPARKVWQRLLTLCEETRRPRDGQVRYMTAAACHGLAMLARREKNWTEAAGWLEQARLAAEVRVRDKENAQTLRALAVIHEQRGYLLRDQGKPAAEAFRTSVRLLERAVRSSRDPALRQEAGEGWLLLADACRREQDPEDARLALEQALASAESLLRDAPSPAARRLYCRALRLCSEQEPDREKALALVRRAWDECASLAEDFPDGTRALADAGSRLLLLAAKQPQLRQTVGVRLVSLRRKLSRHTGSQADRQQLARDLLAAGLAAMLGRDPSTHRPQLLEEAAGLLRQLPSTPASRAELARALFALATEKKLRGETEDRLALLEEYIALDRHRQEEQDQDRDLRDVFGAARSLAELYRAARRWDNTALALEYAMTLWGQLPPDEPLPTQPGLLVNLCLACADQAAPDQRRHWLEYALELLERMHREGLEQAPDDRLGCYRRLAEVCRQEGYPAAAHRWLEKCRLAWQPMADRGDGKARRQLAETLRLLGLACRDEQDPDARARLEQALALWEKICREGGDIRDQSDRETARLDLADLLRDEKRTDEAMQLYRRVLKNRETLLDKQNSPEQQSRLGIVCIRLADLCQAQRDAKGARHWLEQARDLAEKGLLRQPGQNSLRRLLIHALLRLADQLQEEGQTAKARDLLKESLDQFEQITRPAPEDPQLKNSLLDRLSRLCAPDDPARQQFQTQRVQELRALAESAHQPAAWRKLADACRQLADRPGAALSLREEQAHALEQAAALSGEAEDRRAWGRVCRTLSDAYRNRKQPGQAVSWQQTAHTAFATLWETGEDPEDGFTLALCREQLGILHQRCQDPAGARRWFEAEQQLALELQRRDPTRQNRRLSVYALEALASLDRDAGAPPAAMRRYGESLAVAEALCREFAGDASLTWELGHRRYCLVEQSRIQEARGELYEARLLLDKAAICCRDRLAVREDPTDRALMAEYFARLSDLSGRLADKPAARRWLAASCREGERLARQTGSPDHWQKLADRWEELAKLRREAGDTGGAADCESAADRARAHLPGQEDPAPVQRIPVKAPAPAPKAPAPAPKAPAPAPKAPTKAESPAKVIMAAQPPKTAQAKEDVRRFCRQIDRGVADSLLSMLVTEGGNYLSQDWPSMSERFLREALALLMTRHLMEKARREGFT